MTMPSRLAAIAVAQGGVFTAAQARTVGYNADEIVRLCKAGTWARLRRGVYAERCMVPDDELGRHLVALRAALVVIRGTPVASHVTSAALHGIALVGADLSRVHVTRHRSGSSRTGDGLWLHNASLAAGHLTKLDEILATNAARTVVDLARMYSYETALVAAESAVNRGLATLADLREVLTDCSEWPGARNAGRVVAFASPYSESPGETLGRIAFDELGVPQPEQQVLIFDANGRFLGRSDYYWEEQHTVGEFDGKLKYVGKDVADDVLFKEKQREDRLRGAGLELFRIGWTETRARSKSVRHKAFAAFDRAAQSSAIRTYTIKRQPPPK